MLEIIIPILVIVVILAIIVILAVRGKKDIIYKMIYALVNEAEELFGAKTGERKFAYVLEHIYSKLPFYIKMFVTYNMLERWIEKALSEAKDYWANRAGITDGEDNIVVHGFTAD